MIFFRLPGYLKRQGIMHIFKISFISFRFQFKIQQFYFYHSSLSIPWFIHLPTTVLVLDFGVWLAAIKIIRRYLYLCFSNVKYCEKCGDWNSRVACYFLHLLFRNSSSVIPVATINSKSENSNLFPNEKSHTIANKWSVYTYLLTILTCVLFSTTVYGVCG